MKNIETLLQNHKGEKTIMVIFPHPDDETMMTGGLLLKAKKYDYKTIVLTLTKGGEGKVHIHSNGYSTKEIRSRELRKAADILKIDVLISENFPDAKLREGVDKWSSIVSEYIKRHKPGIIVTYDHSGVSGHPDHIVLSVELLNIIAQIDTKHMPVLLWSTFPQKLVSKLDHISRKVVAQFVSNPTYLLSLSLCEYIDKARAARVHKSQGIFSKKYFHSLAQIGNREWYHEVNLDKKYDYKYVDFEI